MRNPQNQDWNYIMLVFHFIRSTAIALAAMATAWSAMAGEGLDLSVVGEPGDAASADRTVEITLGDNFFEPASVTVTRGETVRFVLVNEGEFLHEFNIATPDMHMNHQAEMMVMMEHGMLTATDFEPMPGHSHEYANSVLIRPGETAEVVWTFSGDAQLEFACNVPGHYDAGMAGPIDIVE